MINMCSSVNSNYVTFPHLMHISSKFCSKLYLCIRFNEMYYGVQSKLPLHALKTSG